MIVSAPSDYREAARRRLPPFLFHYIDGGANAENTLTANTGDLSKVVLRQRVLAGMDSVSTATHLMGETLAIPVILAPVGLMGMYARRGEVQAARAAAASGIPFTLSTVSVCSIDEVRRDSAASLWFQLYMLKDRGFMHHVLDCARDAGITTLVFTVDMPVPGIRYRDARSGMSGFGSAMRRVWQALNHPRWTIDVGLRGRPHDLGNVSHYLGKATGLSNYTEWLAKNFDPSISWQDLGWLRQAWHGNLIIKGVLDPADVREAVELGADAIIVSNHGGRQLDGVSSTARALPKVADAARGDLKLLVDSGVRSGLDVLRMLALGADAVMLGRLTCYALATSGELGVKKMLIDVESEIRVAMTLAGVASITEIGRHLIEPDV
jgi:L-lactate dehydrogenase (cytochrome)